MQLRPLEPDLGTGHLVWSAARGLFDVEPDGPGLIIADCDFPTSSTPQLPGAPIDLSRHIPETASSPLLEPPAPPPAAAKHKWRASVVVSCLFHISLALAFVGLAGDEVLIEGADFSGDAMLGNAPDDQVLAGEADVLPGSAVTSVTMIAMLETLPVETIDAEVVPIAEEAEPVRPESQSAQAVETAVPTDRVSAEPAPIVSESPVPETAEASPTSEVQQPAELALAEAAPVQAAQQPSPSILSAQGENPADIDNVMPLPALPTPTETTDSEPVETTVEAEPSEMPLVETPKPVKADKEPPPKPVAASMLKEARAVDARPTEIEKAEKPAPIKKAVGKAAETKAAKAKADKAKAAKAAAKLTAATAQKAKAAKQAGNRGRNQTNARRGDADGTASGGNSARSKGGSKNGALGNASASNYKGQVQAKLARATRSMRAKGRGDVVVSFTVLANGGVQSVQISSSSGVAGVDHAALQAVRRAAPFPPIPANAGRSTWHFVIPLTFSGR